MLPLYTLTLFLSALLLFGVQPMFTKMVLPMLGGSPTVWNTAMLFFQGALLLGYGYAHLTTRWLGLKQQSVLHLGVLVIALLVLPFGVAEGWTPPTESTPIPWLLALFAVSVGLPFFAVSTTAPLLQKWFAHTSHPAAVNPYFLYAGSNVGSILALLSYPTLIEPLLSTQGQSQLWSFGYALLLALIAACAFLLWRHFQALPADQQTREEGAEEEVISWSRRLRWIALAFVPSSLMLGVTLYITTDLVAMPLLWVIPLTLYLLTFVIVFSRRPLIKHEWMLLAQPVLLLAIAVTYNLSQANLTVFAPLHLLSFFVVAMVAHGELVRLRPGSHHLTEFYFWMSVGGVLGGLFNGLVAPLLFNSVLEYPLVMVLAYLLRPHFLQGDARSRALDIGLPLLLLVLILVPGYLVGTELAQYSSLAIVAYAMIFGLLVYLFKQRPLRFALGLAVLFFGLGMLKHSGDRLLAQERSFFGVHKVMLDPTGQFHELYHGTTMHGAQSIQAEYQGEPLTYFHRRSPIGRLFSLLNHTGAAKRFKRIALVGLGAGAIACYREDWQQWTIYEIDPVVVKLASDDRYFSYLSKCAPNADIVLGDARLSLENAPDGQFDLIILDAYSSDVVPVHLITREALQLYERKLAPHGLLAAHISNRHLNLVGVFGTQAADAGLAALAQRPPNQTEAEYKAYLYAADWVVLARTQEDLQVLAKDSQWRPLAADPAQTVWTDDFSNIFGVIDWGKK